MRQWSTKNKETVEDYEKRQMIKSQIIMRIPKEYFSLVETIRCILIYLCDNVNPQAQYPGNWITIASCQGGNKAKLH